MFRMFISKSTRIIKPTCCRTVTQDLLPTVPTRFIRLLSTTTRHKYNLPDVVTRQALLEEATALTKILYRMCLRSVKFIRWGNAFDDKEFEKREEDFLKPSGPGGRISMAPPPDKEDELRSRAEYYHSYAREYFTQESDCLDNDPLREKDIKRYVYYLRKGDKDRKWLLADMMFSDPYKTALDYTRIDRFEAMAKRYLGEEDVEEQSIAEHATRDDYFDADDEDPEWFKTKYPNLK